MNLKTKKAALIMFALFLVFITLLASCDTKDNTSKEQSSNKTSQAAESEIASEVESEVESETVSKTDNKSNESEVTSNTSSATESLEPIKNVDTKYLTVIDCTLTDRNCFVVVGKCEKGASITATTATQNVTTSSDNGFYSVRLKKESITTRVAIVAKGTMTEKYMIDAKPKVPTSDMWPIVGGDGYNFFFQSMMPDFMQTNTLNNSQLSFITDKTKNRINDLKSFSSNTEIIYMIVPSKASIYPEIVPKDYPAGTGESKLKQVFGALEDGGATVVNLLDVFNEHKNDKYKLYWKTDSHWTDYGAYIAYTELFNHISEKFPDASPRAISEFNFEENYYNGGDMIYYMMMDQGIAQEFSCYRTPKFSINKEIARVNRYSKPYYLMYSEETVAERIFETRRSNLPDLYVMRDSYGAHVYDILADRGNTTVYKAMWGYTYSIGDISQYQPDYIIYIVSEWNIDSVIQN